MAALERGVLATGWWRLALAENIPQNCATRSHKRISGRHRMTEKQSRARTSLLKALLLVSALLMGYSDLITTNEILQRGMGELNPFMWLTQEWLGEWWLVAKLGLTYLVIWLLWHGNSERQMAYVVALIALPVYNNLFILAGAN
ncbi:hypothetical protein ACVIGB_002551 [Bradyrhizobium sp. USDA 4341]|uniref:DUF5658 family protein n=1 Tax=Bradyrhizobium erythrophlei TaxID=1437360 RepID=UPI001FCD120F|nr:DUF5658 family protein [Bradyrhizobium erythrophlei]